ncbi:chromosome segregation protein SMC [Sphingobacterium hungaricum]|uniref:Chromosome partition protein Smc n=1 Tax=Sphingobacterium hungaricum TaxID=2082723 RepID=A0A928UXU4_9SPHI|nr:chromosome segregation protein SMC [Sphingobacterium hungaricum]MBE8715231.1 chromosome segregation protein SMC [Sphingobacterium hungaricum]
MQLNKLEIKGFKSFGDKVTINFNEGITAIVGPNGCGKSNVVDAIRWVLGEQSTRMLRSEKMENIIFNGTKNRKASNLAEVSLSFDNTKNILPTEFTSVTITRKLYRSGESEYRLNDVKCRLKDITDLFLDTGIGADSYSIIELKMIDEIINNKDNSRRNLFEEASGVSKYKVRKKQTLSKLRDTEADLSRIEDLLYEINKNLKSLENQAKKAERYSQVKEQYKEKSILLTRHKLVDFQEKLQHIEQREQKQKDKLSTFQATIGQDEASLQKLKLDLIAKEKNLSVQQKATNEHIHRIRTYESEKKIKNEQMRHLEERSAKVQEEIKNDSQQLNHVQYNLKRLLEESFIEEEKLQNSTAGFEVLKSELEELRLQQHSAKAKVDAAAQQAKDKQQQVYAVEKELTILDIQKQALKQESERAINDSKSRETELTHFTAKVDELAEQLATQEDLLTSLQEQETDLESKRLSLTAELNELKELLTKESRTVDAKQNEYSLTKSLVDNLEGFPESIRFLKKNAGWKTAYPLFSDILFCEEEYRIAIENYLEPIMNHYVVDTYQDAIQAIDLLRDASRGKAHFFVLEPITEQHVEQQINKDLIPALAVVSFDSKYKNLCELLLQKVFISSETQLATVLSKESATDHVILQAKGNFTVNHVSVSGGSIGLFEGKRIGRAKNLEILAKEIQKLNQQIEHKNEQAVLLANNLETLKAASRKAEIEELTLLINRINSEYIAIKTKQEQYLGFMAENKSRKEAIESKLLDLEHSLSENFPLLESHKRAFAEQQLVLTELQENYSVLAEDVVEKSNTYNQTNIAQHQQQNKVSSIQKDIEYREAQQQTFEDRLEKNNKELKVLQAEMQDALQFVDLNDVELLDLYSLKETLEQGLKDLEEEYHEEKKRAIDLESNILDFRKEKDALAEETELLRDEKTNLKIELNALKERLSVEFSLDIEVLLTEMEEELTGDFQQIKAECDALKRRLDEFGNINPMAKEAYDEILERFNFIQKEKDDLISAKNSLLTTIQEIDETANHKFMESFNIVRTNFIEVFRSLFNEEDSCDIILSDPKNPLESDIDIMARPKGKRPLSINQLSGGEKTLTSTALLFSLYLLKPAPFCIFDEVDAPLDDTNIDKFNNIIRKFSGQSQFIVVSHNKRTIASTDIIYGVTMVEQGVSRVVAVDLRDVA